MFSESHWALNRRVLSAASRTILLSGVAFGGLSATAVHAQAEVSAAEPEAEEPTTDEIIVSGIRASIESSINKKREAVVVSDVLSSDDIGDLPALSIGEAIETIAGASTHREKGGATEISIRGLGPFLSSTTFNGREATNGSGDRSVNFSMFPSEVINTVAIYKSQQADFVEGGVAGIIDLQTVKPLDFGKRRMQFEARGILQGYDKKYLDGSGLGYRLTGSFMDQLDLGGLGELGISVGYQRGQSNNPEELYNASTTYVACNANVVSASTADCAQVTPASFASGSTPAGTPFYLTSGSATYVQIQENDDREAFFGALQWRPTDTLEINFDYQHSIYEFEEARQQLNLSETLRGINNLVRDGSIPLSYSGNSTIESTPLFREQKEVYDGGGVNIKWDLTDRLTVAADYGWSKTNRVRYDREVRLRSNIRDINNVVVPGVIATNAGQTSGQRINYTYDATLGYLPTIALVGFDPTDADNFSAAPRVRSTFQIRDDEIDSGMFNLSYKVGDAGLTNIRLGARYSEHTFADIPQDRKEWNFNVAATASPFTGAPGTYNVLLSTVAAANRACRIPFPQTDFFGDAQGTAIPSWASFDALCLMNGLTGTSQPGLNADTRAVGNRDLKETTTAVYAMADYALDLGDMPLSGNFGVRYVKTKVDSIGLRGGFNLINNADGTIRLVSNGTFESLTFKNSSERWLPSFNANLDVTDKLRLRMGLFRAMSRPDPEDLGAGRTIALESGTSFTDVESAIRSITASGNPAIKPLMSWNADLSAEYYLNRDSLFSAALYYKKFQGGFINTVRDEEYTVNGQTFTVPVVIQDTSDEQNTIWGFEASASYRFSFLPKPLDGLGFKASYNYANSNFENEDLRLGDQIDAVTGVVTEGIIPPVGIFGLSKHVFSGSVYWDIGPLELQGIYKYRSSYFQQFVGAAAQNRLVRGVGVVDARASLRVTDYLQLTVEGSNLTNSQRIDDMPIPGNVRQVNLYGPRYYFGMRLRF